MEVKKSNTLSNTSDCGGAYSIASVSGGAQLDRGTKKGTTTSSGSSSSSSNKGSKKSGGSASRGSGNSSSKYEVRNSALDRDEEAGLPLLPMAGSTSASTAQDPTSPTVSTPIEKPTFMDHASATLQVSKRTLKFAYCFCGLQFSYLIWGLMQELVMTTEFTPTPLAPSGRFPSSSFCVFSNRLVAMGIAAFICMMWRGGVRGAAPPLAYVPCSLTNTLSSWAQYSALRYVSFPLQSISKSGKVVPVMIMGRFVTGVTYSTVEYIDALLITAGVTLFSLSQLDSDFSSNMIGILLLGVYVTADSFTSQYQSKIYKTYGKVDQYHMMFGVNMWSTMISLASIILAGEVRVIIEFLLVNPTALWYNIISAICGTMGQFFIYATIKDFGPVVFTIIMTTRQMLSTVLSAVYFGHTMELKAGFGFTLVFATVFWSIRRQQQAAAAAEASGGGKGSRNGRASSSGAGAVRNSNGAVELSATQPALNNR